MFIYMSYSGKFVPINKNKYKGDWTKIVFRSTWENAAFKWLDMNPDIKYWNSEEVVIPYICATDRKRHRYFVDLYFENIKGKKYLIEIKPNKETKPPKKSVRRTKKYIREAMTYAKNMSKWEAAREFALDNGCVFFIWTEIELKSLGIKIM